MVSHRTLLALARRGASLVRSSLAGGLSTDIGHVVGMTVVAVLLALFLLLLSWRMLGILSRPVPGYLLWHLYLLDLGSAVLAVWSHATLLYFIVYWKLPAVSAYVGAAVWRRCLGVYHNTSSSSNGNSAGHHLVRRGPSGFVADGGSSDAEVELASAVVTAVPAATTPITLLRQARSAPTCYKEGGVPDERLGALTGIAIAETTAPLLGDLAPSTAVSFGARVSAEKVERWLPLSISAVVVLVAFPHVVMYLPVPETYRNWKDFLLYIMRYSVDAILALINVARVVNQMLTRLTSARGGSGGEALAPRHAMYLRRACCTIPAVVFAAALCVLFRFLFVALTFDTLSHLLLGVTQDGVDVCALEGLRMDPRLAKSWVLPALTHRRILNFYTGRESCAVGRSTPPLSLVVEAEQLLVVSSVCPDGQRPHIYLHRPERSEFSGASDVKLPETESGNLEYHRQLEALYGTVEAAAAHGVVVHRDTRTKLITAVEVDPRLLRAGPRVSGSVEETKVRRRWPRAAAGRNGKVLQVRLGRSPAYTVYCAGMDREEYHLWPVDDALLDSYSAALRGAPAACMPHTVEPSAGAAEPAGNVLMLLFDAVSRQEVRRALPKFSMALQELAKGTPGGHVVVEPQGTMTLGMYTSTNLVPFLTGMSDRVRHLRSNRKLPMESFMSRSVFTLAKAKYGDTLSTSFTSAFCHDIFEYLMGHVEPSSGAGGRVMGVDRYYYQPFCHLDYSGYMGNFKGPYSIVTRCMAGEEVWKHSVNYTERLLRKQLRDSGRARGTLNATAADVPKGVKGDCATSPGVQSTFGKHFFHTIYMTEGHEGAHAVLPLLDDTLTRFLADLRGRLRFFDDPRNTFVMLADHGNHMGPYYVFTNAGEYERGTPPLLFAVSPDVLSRVDHAKGRPNGTSLTNLQMRARRISTSLDIYPTLADLLNINVTVHEAYRAPHMVQAASFFDARDPKSAATPVRKCAQFYSVAEAYPCPLDFCVPRE